MDKRIIKKKVKEEIARVAEKKAQYFDDGNLDKFFLACERLNGLFYTYYLLKGEEELASCYETGRNNSHGFK